MKVEQIHTGCLAQGAYIESNGEVTFLVLHTSGHIMKSTSFLLKDASVQTMSYGCPSTLK